MTCGRFVTFLLKKQKFGVFCSALMTVVHFEHLFGAGSGSINHDIVEIAIAATD